MHHSGKGIEVHYGSEEICLGVNELTLEADEWDFKLKILAKFNFSVYRSNHFKSSGIFLCMQQTQMLVLFPFGLLLCHPKARGLCSGLHTVHPTSETALAVASSTAEFNEHHLLLTIWRWSEESPSNTFLRLQFHNKPSWIILFDASK